MAKLTVKLNSRALASQKPPVLVFLACLVCFVLVLISFVGYINNYEVHNPDELDWNVFRERMASLDYCVKYPNQYPKSMVTKQPSKSAEKKNSYTYDLTIEVGYWGKLEELKNLKTIDGKIDGLFIGKEKEILDIQFQIHKVEKDPANFCDKRLLNEKNECHDYLVSGCVLLTASERIFPKTQAPETCSFKQTKSKFANQTTEFIVYKETPDLPYHYWCPSTLGAKSTIKNSKDPSLSLFLTQADKQLICRNLIYTIVALSAIIGLIFVCKCVNLNKKRSVYVYSQITEM